MNTGKCLSLCSRVKLHKQLGSKITSSITPFAVHLQKINIHLCPNFFLYGQ